MASFCAKYKIIHRFSTLYYPQGNGQAEISNRTILNSLCKSLDEAKGKWAEKLSGVLWAYRTTKRVPTSETEFSLAYEIEVFVLVSISMPTLRVERVDSDQNNAQLCLTLDQSEEKRQQMQICIAAYQQQIWAVHYKKVKIREF